MRTLGIHSAGLGCSAALISGDAVLAERRSIEAQSQAERLMPMILEVLGEAGVGIKEVDRFGVTTGPGTFTGLRIGLATVRGLALATGRQAVGITAFDAVAHGVPDSEIADRQLLVALESKRSELFVQLYDSSRTPLGEPFALPPQELASLCAGRAVALAGDGSARLLPFMAGEDVRLVSGSAPEAVTVARLAARRDGTTVPRPFYMRAPDVTLPKGGQ